MQFQTERTSTFIKFNFIEIEFVVDFYDYFSLTSYRYADNNRMNIM